MSGLLFVSGGAEHQAAVRRAEGRADWAAALPLVLEKHGLLGFDVAVPGALAGPEPFAGHDVVLIARLPEAAWTPALVQAVAGARCPVLVEGPAPAAVRALAGVAATGPVETAGLSVSGRASVLDPLARPYGGPPVARLGPATSRPLDRDPKLEWTAIPEVPLTLEQAEAWRARGWDAEAWSVEPGAEVLATMTPDAGGVLPAVVRRGHVTLTAVSLFAALGQAHTSEPWDGPESRNSPRAIGLELLLLALVDELHRQAGAVRHRVLPWPEGSSWVLNVRHDFDRPLKAAQVRRLLARHDGVGTSATWYWRWRHLMVRHRERALFRHPGGLRAIQAVAQHPGHEVALHTERMWLSAQREREVVEQAIEAPIVGVAPHGDPGCFRFQGAPNVLWAEREGLLYTDFMQSAHYHPHRFAALEPDGRIRTADVVCLPHHESFDRTMQPGGGVPERILARQPAFAEHGGMLQVMNHPDLHNDELFTMLAALPREGRLDWTARQAAAWWRATHTRERLSLEPRDDGRCAVASAEGVAGLVLEARQPDGALHHATLTLGPGERAIAAPVVAAPA